MDQPRECEHTRFWASGVSEQCSMRMPRRSAAEQAARVNRALLFKLGNLPSLRRLLTLRLFLRLLLL